MRKWRVWTFLIPLDKKILRHYEIRFVQKEDERTVGVQSGEKGKGVVSLRSMDQELVEG
jgi:hypothetical protein